MRSFLFVPADDARKLAKGLGSGSDALIVDLEDSVAPARKEAARGEAAAFLRDAREREYRPRLFVRINPLAGGLADVELATVVAAGADGIVLPKAEGGASVQHLAAKLAVAEAEAGRPDGEVGILAIATETAQSLFVMGSFAGASRRLAGLTWGGEDLSAALGAETNRRADGGYADVYRLARALTLAAAVAAEAAPVDAVFTAFRDLDGLRAEALAARKEGFTAKLAIHPAQVPVINEVFTPAPEAIAGARRVLDAVAAAGDAGVVALDGEMIDRPHIVRAERVLARAAAAGLV